MTGAVFTLTEGKGPLVATAIHNGHAVRPELLPFLKITEADRLREEDPYTGLWTLICETRIVVERSRFEVDMNRPRERAVYLNPEDCWELEVWREAPPQAVIARSLDQYDRFYRELERVLSSLRSAHGRFVVLDLHSFNHRRNGPDAPPSDPETHPEVNVGTGSLDRLQWGPVVDRFMSDLRQHSFMGRSLDVRENINFKGGFMSGWIHETFAGSGCALAVEFKKFFMDEWTGRADPAQLDAIAVALRSTLPGIMEELARLG